MENQGFEAITDNLGKIVLGKGFEEERTESEANSSCEWVRH